MGWFLINILLPLIAPLIAALVFKVVPLPAPISLMAPFKDGQLCWGALGFCASALYEMAKPVQRAPPITEANNWISGAIILSLVFAALLAATGATFATPIARPPGMVWHRHYACFLFSIADTLFAAGCYVVVHYGIL